MRCKKFYGILRCKKNKKQNKKQKNKYRPDDQTIVLIIKKKCRRVDFAVLKDLSEKKIKSNDKQILGHCSRTKKTKQSKKSLKEGRKNWKLEEERINKTIILLRTARILGSVLKTFGDLLSFKRNMTRCIAICFHLCWCHSDDLFVLARNPQKGPEDEISRETGSGRGKEGQREDREQLTNQDKREQSAWDNCPENETVSRRR